MEPPRGLLSPPGRVGVGARRRPGEGALVLQLCAPCPGWDSEIPVSTLLLAGRVALGKFLPLLCEPQLRRHAEPSARKAQLSILCSAIQGPHNTGGAPIVSGMRCRAPEQISKLGQNRDVHRLALRRGCGSKEGPPHSLPVSDTEVRLPTGASFLSPPSPGVWHLTSSHFFFTHTHRRTQFLPSGGNTSPPALVPWSGLGDH